MRNDSALGKVPIIRAKDLTKRFGRNTVLDGITFSVGAGEVVLLAGPNGSGKSTVLKILSGVIRSSRSSELSVFGLDPWKGRASIFRRAAAVFEDYSFPEFSSSREFIEFEAKARGTTPADAVAYAQGLFNISSFWDQAFRTYSSGMKRKVALAQGLAFNVDLLMLDEPYVALDAISRRELVDVLTRRKESGRTILMTSHVTTGLDNLVDRMLVISDGKIIEDLPTSELDGGLASAYEDTLKHYSFSEKSS
jgi:ABC-2 type transport system ATP-binding protein